MSTLIAKSIACSVLLTAVLINQNITSLTDSNIRWGIATEEEGGYYGDSTFGGATNVDLVSAPWILEGWKDNHSLWASSMKLEENDSKSPYITMYVVAGMARRDNNLQDANVVAKNASNSLANSGAEYLRENKEEVLTEYENAISQIANSFGNREVYLHIEPDFWQYQSDSQNGGGINYQLAHEMMNRISSLIRTYIPNAKIVMDVAPWSDNLEGWFSGFLDYDFVGLVGKEFSANQVVDGKTYEEIYNLTGQKKIIVNTAHGVGGHFIDYNESWESIESEFIHAVIQPPLEDERYQQFIDSQTGEEPLKNEQVEEVTPTQNQRNFVADLRVEEELIFIIIANQNSDESQVILNLVFTQNGIEKKELQTSFDVTVEKGGEKEIEVNLLELGEGGIEELQKGVEYELSVGIHSNDWSTTHLWLDRVTNLSPNTSTTSPTEPKTPENSGMPRHGTARHLPHFPEEVEAKTQEVVEIGGQKYQITTLIEKL